MDLLTKTACRARIMEAQSCSQVMALHTDQVDSEYYLQDVSPPWLMRCRGVFTDTSRGLVLYYHYADTDVGLADADYLFGWNTLSWSSGWPVV